MTSKLTRAGTGVALEGAGGSVGRRFKALLLLAGLVVLVLGLVPEAGAEIVTYQKGDGKGTVSETDDITVNGETGNRDTNYDYPNEAPAYSCVVDNDQHQHCLVKFPNIFGGGADQIPPGSLILSATLTMYQTDAGQGGSNCPTVYQITDAWTESEATWNDRMTGVAWTDATGGADGPLSRSTNEGLINCDSGNGVYESLDVTTSVQNWSNGDANEGWVFTNSSNNNGIDYRDSEYGTLAERPELEVDYVPAVFYSVGTNAADLKDGAPKISISNGLATLDVAQTTNDIGVGDVIDFGGTPTQVFIWDVLSSTQFRVQTSVGNLPVNATNQDVNFIKRAFNAIQDAVDHSADATWGGIPYLGNADLTAVDRKLTWICYKDGPFLEEVQINGYTSDAFHFTTLTVAGATQVVGGASQRHTGTAGTGAVLRPQAGSGIKLQDAYGVVEWLEIDGSDMGSGTPYGIDDDGTGGDNGSYRNLLVHDFDQDPNAACLYFESSSNEIRNTIAYGCGRGVRFKFGDNNELYNSTFYDIIEVGVYATDSSVGNVVQNVVAVGSVQEDFLEASGADFGTFDNNISEDNTAGLYGGSGHQTGVIAASLFASFLPGPVDLHLFQGSPAIDAGKDLAGIFSNDIDEDPRPQGAGWDVGADETGYSPNQDVYYSVGTNSNPLQDGPARITISNGLATLDVAQTTNDIGVGDVIDHDTDNKTVYIWKVVSSTQFLVQTPIGTPPTSVTNVDVNSIKRAFSSISAAVSGSLDANHLTSGNLTTVNRKLTWICYDDAPLVESVQINGYTTDADRHITLTVAGASQVATGNSQRHDGTAGTGAVLRPSGTPPYGFSVEDAYTTLEWLEVDGSNVGGTAVDGVQVENSGGENALLQNLIVHDWHQPSAGGVYIGLDDVTVRNSIIYLTTLGMQVDGDNAVIRNVTAWDNNDYAFLATTSSGHVVENVIAAGSNADDFCCGSGVTTFDNNISGDASTDYYTGSGNQKNVSASSLFQNIASGSEDLHLRPGANAIDAGKDLSSAFTGDIDDQTRYMGNAWDVGADEFGGGPAPNQIHYRWRNDDGNEAAASWAANEDTAITGLPKLTNRRVRFEVSNEGPQAATAATWQLQVAQTATCSAGTYAAVPTGATGHWQIADSSNLTNGAATTNVAGGLTDEATTFVAGETRDTSNTTGAITLGIDEFTEVEFSVRATSNAVNGASYCFRLYDTTTGTTLAGYSAYAQATLATPTLTLSNHASGQVPDAFTNTTPVTATLFRFRLAEVTDVTVDTLRVNFTTGAGVANGDVSAGELWEDTNANGTWDDTGGGDTLLQGSVTPVAGVLTFTSNFSPDVTPTSYFLRATTSNLISGDTTTFSLGLADIDTVEGAAEAGAATNAIHIQDVGNVVFYSVGTSWPGDLKNATPTLTVTIAGGVATFSEAQPNNVGVGDEVTYGGGTKAYIAGRTSSTVYALQTATGAAAAPVTNSVVTSITRAFASLTAAESGSQALLGGTQDLVANDTQLNWACYDDGPLDDALILVRGWNTDPAHFLRIFTPTATSEVGVSQRHTGLAGTGFRIVPNESAPGGSYQILQLEADYSRVEGVEIDGSSITNGEGLFAIRVDNVSPLSSDLRFDSLLVHDFTNTPINQATNGRDVFPFFVREGSTKISNSIFYAFELNNNHNEATIAPLRYEGGGNHFAYNVTIYDVKNPVSTGSTRGVENFSALSLTARSVAVFDVVNTLDDEQCFFGVTTGNNNVSSDATATGTGSQTLKTDYVNYFASITPGNEDLHLLNDSSFLWGSDGADLDNDPDLPVTTDIDGEARSATTPDIGADEFGDRPVPTQIHYRWRNDDGNEAAATWAANEDTAITGLPKLTNRRVRFEVSNEGTQAATAATWQLQVAQTATCSAGTYAAVPTGATGHWQIRDTANLANGGATTNVAGGLTDEATTFVAGETRDTSNTTGAITLGLDEFSEVEFSVWATANAVDGASYCFRLYDTTGGTTLSAYSAYAQATLATPTLTLSNHASGQVPDAFTTTTPVTATLFRFRLARTFTVTVDTLRVNFTTGTGVANGDVSGGELWEDTNGNGTWDDAGGGDTLLQGSVAPLAGVLTFTSNFSPDATPTTYFVRATTSSLIGGDTTTFSLGLADIDTVEGAAEAGAATNATHLQDVGNVVFYSVGTSWPGDLKNATPTLTVTIAGGVATFSEAQPDNVGVGDEVTYGGGTKAYIAGRTSSTVYALQTATGAAAAPVTNSVVTSITRAFASLTAAESGSQALLGGTQDLVANDTQLNWACYDDGPMNDGGIRISGWTTGPAHYIRVFSPVTPTEVGVTQRHNGVAGSGFRLVPAIDVAGGDYYVLQIQDDYVRLEGVEIDGSSIANADFLNAIQVGGNVASDIRLESLVVHDFANVQQGDDADVFIVNMYSDASTRISNSVFYNFENRDDTASSSMAVIHYPSGGTAHYLHNVTIYNVTQTASTSYSRGVNNTLGAAVTARNVAVFDVTNSVAPSNADCFNGVQPSWSNNVSSDATATGTGSQTLKTDYVNYFISITPGSEDLHLLYDSSFLWGSDGADLDNDPDLPVTTDIDGEVRDATAPDIGADEIIGPPPPATLTQIHTRWRNDDGGESGGSGISVAGVSPPATYDGVSTVAFSHTVAAGTNRLLLVGVSFNNFSGETVTSVVWKDGLGDEQTLTPVGTAISVDDARVEIWGRVAPNTGTADIRVTFDATLNDGGVVGAMSFTGVDQSTPYGTFVSDFDNSGSSNLATVDVSSAVGELVFDTVACETCTSLTVGAGQDERWNTDNANSDFGGASTEAGAGTVTMSWDLGSSDYWVIGAVPIKPAAGGSGATWAAAEDAALTGLSKGTLTRARFEVSNEGAAGSGAVAYRLQVAETATCSAGAYTDVPTDTSGHWQVASSAFITDGEATTNVAAGLTDEATTFVAGELKDAGNTTGGVTLAADEFTEIEFAVQATANATDAGSYCFRLYDSTGAQALDAYSAYARVTLAAPPAPDLTQSHSRWRNDDGGESTSSGANDIQATATGDTTTTSNSDVVVNSMTITPGAGDYHVWFSSSVENSSTSQSQFVSIYVDGVKLAHTEREMYQESSLEGLVPFPVATHARVTGVLAGQAIDVRWRTTGGTATMHERTLLVSPITAADSTQASATADDTTISTSDVLVDSMTLTPGAGDYHVWFSGSLENDLDSEFQYVSLYVNGVKLAHTERQVTTDDSIPDTSFPVATHARVTGVLAGQAIEARWRTTGGSATVHERTLVVSKITPADSTEVSATGDTTTISTTDVVASGMTITPGAGDYRIWFSSSVENSSVGDYQHVSIYVNGVQLAHTEREIFTEGSIPDTSFPIATHARVAGVLAGQAIDVRWRTEGGTATMHERTLVVEKVVTPVGSSSATWATAEDAVLTDLAKGVIKRVRLEVSNEGSAASGAVAYRLQVAEAATCAAGAYSDVPTDGSGHWQILDSTHLTDGAVTTNVIDGLTDEASTFVAGEVKDTGNTTGGITLAVDEMTEIEFAVQATGNATDGAQYCFRLYDSTGAQALDSYTGYGRATLAAAPPTASLTLADVATGQVTDRLADTTPVTDTFFQLKLTRFGTVTVDAIRVGFTTTDGILDGDLSGVQLYRDTNGSGSWDGGDAPIGAAIPAGGVVAFTSLGEVPALTGTNYFVRATIGNLVGGDTTTFSLGAGGIDQVQGGVVEIGSISNAIHTQDAGVGEVADVYYSVGTSRPSNLATGSPLISILNGTATLSAAQTGDVGVGDEIEFSGTFVYIKAVLSQTSFVVHAPNGSRPADAAPPVPVTAIRRAFGDIATAESNSSNGSHLGTANLISASARVHWVCYDDGPFNITSNIYYSGYSTDAAHYTTTTVAGASQVASGNSQRHNGVAGTGVTVEVQPGSVWAAFEVEQPYARIEWLEIDGNDELGVIGIYNWNAGNTLYQNLIIHNVSSTTPSTFGDGIGIWLQSAAGSETVRNCVIYDYDEDGIYVASPNATIHNTTIFRTRKVVNPGEGLQLGGAPSSATAVNVISMSNDNDFFVNSGGALTCTRCLSEDGTADNFGDPSSLVNKDPLLQFESTTGSVNLHLRAGADAINSGQNLSGTFTSDIDGATRPAVSPPDWDVGADEFSGTTPATTNYRSIGSRADYGTSATEGNATTVSVTQGSPTVTGMGTAWMARNRGRGDVLTVGGVDYTVLSVDSNGTLTLTEDYAGATESGASYLLQRQFTTLQAWENCISGSVACDPFPVGSANLVADDRSEVGVAYEDSVFTLAADFEIKGSTTDANHTITLTADGVNRHRGVPGAGVVVDGNDLPNEIIIEDSNVTVEWLEIVGIKGPGNIASIRVLSNTDVPTNVLLQNLMIHDFLDLGNIVAGIRLSGGPGKGATVRNTMIWDGDFRGIEGDEPEDTLVVENCTIDGMADSGRGIASTLSTIAVRNTIVTGSTDGDFVGNFTGSHNTSSDASAPVGNEQHNILASALFISPGSNLHLKAGSPAIDTGTDLSAPPADIMPGFDPAMEADTQSGFGSDIDAQPRPLGAAWDRGADEDAGTTAVGLARFEAVGGDGFVEVHWSTASERSNAGFHLYRGLGENGPWERINEHLIRGLGSSPTGQEYSYLDPGLANGTTYFYRLEDVEYSGQVTSHGPVSATPQAAVQPPGRGEGPEPPAPVPGPVPGPGPAGEGWTVHGDPSDVSVREVSRSSTSVTFEVRTGGFYALTASDGTTRLAVPGFVDLAEPGMPMLPLRRLWTPAVTGHGARVVSAQATDTLDFDGFRLPTAGEPALVEAADGTKRASFRAVPARDLGPGSWPHASARVLQTAFQGETKKAYVEIAPLTLDAASGRLTLARTLLVQVLFDGTVPGETGSGSRGRHAAEDLTQIPDGQVLARFGTQARGVHAVSFEDALGVSFDVVPTSRLFLSRKGVDTSFLVAPRASTFGPGSVLYFFSEGAHDAYGTEAVYELVLSMSHTSSTRRLLNASPDETRAQAAADRGLASPAVPYLRASRSFELDAIFSSDNTAVDELWVWDYGIAYGWGPSYESADYAFDVTSPAAGAENVRLVIHVQGASIFNHHVLASVNGTPVGESSFAGTGDHSIAIAFSPALLLDGANTLTLAVAPDSELYSHVKLDRFEVTWPTNVVASAGILEGEAPVGGTVSASGFGAGSLLLDLSEDTPRWLRSPGWGGDTLTFYAKADHRYLGVSTAAVLAPSVHSVDPNTLRDTQNQADWILIAPREFLAAAQPLVLHRQGQGLSTMAVTLEDVYAAFSHGEPDPQAIKAFLSFAFHSWAPPSPRYVFLLGEATYDPKGRLGARPRSDRLPTSLIRGPFGWTASDLDFAAINGPDDLPDIAIGRLNVNDLTEATAGVQKIIDFENDPSHDLFGNAVFVADTPDPRAGDFETNVHDIAAMMPTRPVQKLFRRSLGDVATHASIVSAFDAGASFMSYVGHGGSGIWAYHTVLNAGHAAGLLAQTRQPLLLTMTCSTGYFLSPYSNSITEAFVLAEGRGAIAAFSPTSESYNDAAHVFHSVFVQRLESGSYQRIGDLVLDAQTDYADSGAFPELLRLYHLFGDPALMVTSAP